MADQLISTGHSESATISEWKNGINELWESLMNQINSRFEVIRSKLIVHLNIANLATLL